MSSTPTVTPPFSNVIAGVDGRDSGRDAAALADALCRGRLTLVDVYPPTNPLSWGAVVGYDKLLQDDAQRVLDAARHTVSSDAQTLAIADRSPALALQRAALQHEADLLVIGSAHHGLLSRLLLGDVGRGVLRGAPCPVAVAPRRFRARKPRTVAVGFDGSAQARAALDLATRFATDVGAALTVCVVWEEPPMPLPPAAHTPGVRHLQGARRLATEQLLTATLATLPRSAAGRVLHGHPATELARAAQDFDLLVVGSRSWGPVKRTALGSTSDRLLHRAPCPVLIVPRPVEGAGQQRSDRTALASLPV